MTVFQYLILNILLLNLSVLVDSINNEDLIDLMGRSPCALIHDLKQCIAKPECSYCVKQDYKEPHRCDTRHRLESTGCGKDIFESTNQTQETVIEPHKQTENVSVHLLPGMTRNVSISFSLLAHPIDLYYLMDFSSSMGGDKANLVRLADKLSSSIKNISDDYRLGLGSFVDKPISPFGASTDYVFKNRIPLTNYTSNFAEIVNSTKILSGADDYEGTGEAMLQAVVCRNQIGWRENARRILLVATDTGFHVAGDGVQAKITKPNDGLCHLDSSGEYTEALNQDYPSIEQIKNAIELNSIVTIFAIRASGRAFYDKLSKNITASTVGVLATDSTNVLDLINAAYDQIHSRVELQHTNPSTSELSVKFYSNCHGELEKVTNVCDKLPKNGVIKFTVSIDLNNCPKDPKDWDQKITVSPIGLPIKLEINANLVCGLS